MTDQFAGHWSINFMSSYFMPGKMVRQFHVDVKMTDVKLTDHFAGHETRL